jgi:hypothetical protein
MNAKEKARAGGRGQRERKIYWNAGHYSTEEGGER